MCPGVKLLEQGICICLLQCETAFQSGCARFLFSQQYRRFPVALSSQLTLGIVRVFNFSQTGIQWYLIITLICVSVISKVVEHLFVCLLAVLVPSSVECLNNSCSIFNWVACFFPINTQQFFIHSRYESNVKYMCYRYFPLVCGLPFYYFNGAFLLAALNFLEVHFISLLWLVPFESQFKKPLPTPKSCRYFLVFFQNFYYLIFHIQVYGTFQINFYVWCTFSYLLKKLSFLPLNCMVSFS